MSDKDRRNCRHEELLFGSGAFYIFCKGCYQQWTATTPGNDYELDFAAGSDAVCGESRIKDK